MTISNCFERRKRIVVWHSVATVEIRVNCAQIVGFQFVEGQSARTCVRGFTALSLAAWTSASVCCEYPACIKQKFQHTHTQFCVFRLPFSGTLVLRPLGYETDVALEFFCNTSLLGIKWHQFVRNEEVQRLTGRTTQTHCNSPVTSPDSFWVLCAYGR